MLKSNHLSIIFKKSEKINRIKPGKAVARQIKIRPEMSKLQRQVINPKTSSKIKFITLSNFKNKIEIPN